MSSRVPPEGDSRAVLVLKLRQIEPSQAGALAEVAQNPAAKADRASCLNYGTPHVLTSAPVAAASVLSLSFAEGKALSTLF